MAVTLFIFVEYWLIMHLFAYEMLSSARQDIDVPSTVELAFSREILDIGLNISDKKGNVLDEIDSCTRDWQILASQASDNPTGRSKMILNGTYHKYLVYYRIL